MTTPTYTTPEERVTSALLEQADLGFPEWDPWEVAASLCDEDVSTGQYDGCSVELELAFTEYLACATRMLGERN